LNEANQKFLANIKKLVDRSVRLKELTGAEGEHLPLFVTAMVNGMVTLSRGGATRYELEHIVQQTLANWPDRTEHR